MMNDECTSVLSDVFLPVSPVSLADYSSKWESHAHPLKDEFVFHHQEVFLFTFSVYFKRKCKVHWVGEINLQGAGDSFFSPWSLSIQRRQRRQMALDSRLNWVDAHFHLVPQSKSLCELSPVPVTGAFSEESSFRQTLFPSPHMKRFECACVLSSSIYPSTDSCPRQWVLFSSLWRTSQLVCPLLCLRQLWHQKKQLKHLQVTQLVKLNLHQLLILNSNRPSYRNVKSILALAK